MIVLFQSGLPLLRFKDHERGLCGHPCQEQPPCPRPQHPLYSIGHPPHLIKTRLLVLSKGHFGDYFESSYMATLMQVSGL